MPPRPLSQPLRAVAIALLLVVATGGRAQEETWRGEITLTTTGTTSGGGAVGSWRTEERWSDFRVVGGEPGADHVAFVATWSVIETRSSTSSDCTSSGRAAGSGSYPWFRFEVDPFDDLGYLLASGGYGGGPEATGAMTVRCRLQAPYDVEYRVPASWLPAVPFAPPGGVLGMLTDEERGSLPQETLDMMREIDAMLLEHDADAGFGVRGRVSPGAPHVFEGTASREEEGGTVVLAWSLERSFVCRDDAFEERLRHEAEALRRLEPASSEAGWDVGHDAFSGSPLSVADAAAALRAAVGADAVALRAPVGSDAAGIQSFGVRLSASGQVLPTVETLRQQIETTCVEEGSLEGARLLVVGSIQWDGHRYRITARSVDVETGTVIETVRVDGAGGAEALPAAVSRALSGFLLRS
jgi:hypothetical protein